MKTRGILQYSVEKSAAAFTFQLRILCSPFMMRRELYRIHSLDQQFRSFQCRLRADTKRILRGKRDLDGQSNDRRKACIESAFQPTSELPILIDKHVLTASEMQGLSPYMDSKLHCKRKRLKFQHQYMGFYDLPGGELLGKGLARIR